MNIHDFLDQHDILYDTIVYRRGYDGHKHTCLGGNSAEIKAKPVLLKSKGLILMAILPAGSDVDIGQLRRLFRTENVEETCWKEVSQRFPDHQDEPVLPFGSRYGMTTLMDESVSEAKGIVFDDLKNRDAVRLQFSDYCCLEQPVVIRLSQPTASGSV